MLHYLILYLVSLLSLLGIDMVWLNVVAKKLYAEEMGNLLSKTPQVIPAIIFYLLYVAGILFFVTIPAIKNNNIMSVVFSGALFGLCCYATYDLTNLAVIQNWSIKLTIIDLLWGTFLTVIVVLAGVLFARKFLTL